MATVTHKPAEPSTNGDTTKGSPSLDSMLTDAALGSGPRWMPGLAGVKAAARLAVRPDRLVRRSATLWAEMAKIAVGRSDVAPAKGDRRFKDPAWTGNPAFKRLGQGYIAYGQAVDRLIDDAGLAWADERRLRFAAENILDALAPSNFPATNPAVLKATLDTGGQNFLRGARHLISDMAPPPRVPSMVNRSPSRWARTSPARPARSSCARPPSSCCTTSRLPARPRRADAHRPADDQQVLRHSTSRRARA